jgi:hypothetical protein
MDILYPNDLQNCGILHIFARMKPTAPPNKMNMQQIERISKMEFRMDRISAIVMELSAVLDKYAAVQDDIAALSEYYGSDEWKQDFTDDEAGILPSDLKRGVLSEDGLWNLLSDNRELMERMKEMTSK